MEENELLFHVKKLIANSVGTELNSIKDDSMMGDFPSWDSFGHMAIMAALETEYKIDIDCTKLVQLTDVPAILGWVAQVLENRERIV